MKHKINSALVLEAMSPEYSSYEDEEGDFDSILQGSDNEEAEIPKRKVIKTLPLSWTSPELTNILESLDRKTMRRKSEKARSMVLSRLQGEPIESRSTTRHATVDSENHFRINGLHCMFICCFVIEFIHVAKRLIFFYLLTSVIDGIISDF